MSLACAALMLLSLPIAAHAEEFSADGPTAFIAIQGSHGYKLHVSLEDGNASLTARKDEGDSEVLVSYSDFEAKAGRRLFTANFGKVGKISVRFQPIGKPSRFRDDECSGAPHTDRRGVFVGTIRFRGEGGFSSFSTRRVKGEVSYTPVQNCHFRVDEVGHLPGQKPGPVVTSFFAYSPSRQLSFEARSETGDEKDELIASTFESRGHVSITREVVADADPSAFSFDPALNSATVAPPAPFVGSASFQRIDDHASRWDGPLAVAFPGLGEVPLTGRDYSWNLIAS